MTDLPLADIGLATHGDADAILALLQANLRAAGGMLTGSFTRDWVLAQVESHMPVLVARRGSPVVAVLFTASREAEQAPVVAAMLAAWPGPEGAYVYGPVCIAGSERGTGLLARLYAALREQLPGRAAVLFIRADNEASRRAHERLGMREVAAYALGGEDFLVLTDAAL